MYEGEKLLKAFHLCTTAGPIPGLLFISTEKVAFCGERWINVTSSTGQVLATLPYKVLVPIRKIKRVNRSENVKNPEEKYIETVNDCVYTLYVKTGWMMKAGTDSRISVVLGDSFGRSVWIPELRSWGLMPDAHDYFERGSLDVFSGRGSCIGSPCRLNLTSDGSEWHHGWYCDYIEVTSTGPQQPCAQTVFYVDQWLATDIPPFQLTAFRDGCYMRDEPRKRGRNVPLIVGNPERPA